MKKVLCGLLVVVLCIGAFVGCGEKKEWSEKDFSFYDPDGRETIYASTDDYFLELSECEDDIKTFRGVQIGDKSKDALANYDLTDFRFEVSDPEKMKKSDKDEFYQEKYKTFSALLKDIDSIAAEGLEVYATCDIYKQNGKYCTESKLKKVDDQLPKFQQLRATITFVLTDRVKDVMITDNYYNQLNGWGASNAPDWLKELK